jgi:hypothetical protein
VKGEHPAAAGLGIAGVGEKGLDARQRRTLGLGLDDADGLAVDKEQIVGVAGAQGKFAHGNTPGRAQVELVTVLDTPACLGEQVVNGCSGFFLWCRHESLTCRSNRDEGASNRKP